MTLLEVSGLTKTYRGGRGSRLGRPTRVVAVDDVSFDVARGETFALVGESGAGKSTVGRLIGRLTPPDRGKVALDGLDLMALGRSELRHRRKDIQMVFQDPYNTLDPRVTVGESVAEPLLVHHGVGRRARLDAAEHWLARVGLDSRFMTRLPRELSGGQLQRACIARALILEPKLVVCDEPTAALDVSVQAQVLNTMRELQRSLGVTLLFITHDLALVEAIAEHVAIMSSGRIVERGRTEEIFRAPAHEYTRRLLDAVPVPVPKRLRAAHTTAARGPADHDTCAPEGTPT